MKRTCELSMQCGRKLDRSRCCLSGWPLTFLPRVVIIRLLACLLTKLKEETEAKRPNQMEMEYETL